MEVEQPQLKDILSMVVNLLLAGMILQVRPLKKLLTTENLAHHQKTKHEIDTVFLDEASPTPPPPGNKVSLRDYEKSPWSL